MRSSPPPLFPRISRPRRLSIRGRWGVFALSALLWTANTALVLASPGERTLWALGRVGVTTLLLALLAIVIVRFHRARVAQERRANADLARLAHTDPLTGLANRRGFDQRLAEEVERARRYHRPLALVLLDLDQFKSINDTHGHAAGDQALVTLAGLLTGLMRTTDLVARLGGDEFAVILPETDAAGATDVVARLKGVLGHWPLVLAQTGPGVPLLIRLRSSAGAATLGDEVPDAAALVMEADRQLYRDKRSQGR